MITKKRYFLVLALCLLFMLFAHSFGNAAPDSDSPQSESQPQTPLPSPNSPANQPPPPQLPQPQLTPASSLPLNSAYTLRIFAEEEVARNPNNTFYAYVNVVEDSTVTAPAELDLWYSYSPTARTDLSAISVSLNGVPVSSNFLGKSYLPLNNWKIPLPVEQFQSGSNEIAITVLQRTIDGLCRDIDNDANWFIVRPETRVNFNLTSKPLHLAQYPRPFLDSYVADNINTVVYLPEGADQTMLSALLNFAASWGAAAPAGLPQHLEVRLGQPGQTVANEVVFKLSAENPGLQVEELPGGYARLTITGTNTSDIAKAVAILKRPQLMRTFTGRQMALPKELPVESFNITDLAKKAADKKGLHNLLDLGYESDINVAGAFHQEATIIIPKPSNYSIGKGSFVELHFRHSKILDPKKSAVTVAINGVNVGSSVLTVENSEGGVLKIPIPESEFNSPYWTVNFAFYHDLGIIDCSKRYDDVAWSVIDKKTNVYLAPGRTTNLPDLVNFPNTFWVSPGSVINLTMLLPENLSQDEINAAFKVAYFIGQHNLNTVLDVQNLATYDVQKAPGTVIAMGRKNNPEEWNLLREYLSVYPLDDGSFYIARWIEVLNETLANFDIYQVVRFSEEKAIYAFMYSDAKKVISLFERALVSNNQLSGQVALVDPGGRIIAFTNPGMTEKLGDIFSLETINEFLADNTTITYIVIFIIVIIATIGMMYYTRRN